MKTITASVRYDDERKFWYVRHCDMPGITTESNTLDDLCAKLPQLIQGLTEANGELVTEEIQVKITVYTAIRVQKSTADGQSADREPVDRGPAALPSAVDLADGIKKPQQLR